MSETSDYLSVSRLNALLREMVEDNFVDVWVEGEISNFALPASGHFYFSLKDDTAQIKGVMFRPQNRILPFRPENGLQVVCRGRVTLYAQRGELQLVVEAMEPKGVGGLQLAFEQLKARLAAEGLFAPERKRPLPAFPRTVGVVTSASGAAIHDILTVLRQRAPGLRVLLAPVRVQGDGAAAEIAVAITNLNRSGLVDVMIVGRGGGSLEDLWAFNEESVARAIHASAIPVVAAVGHEIDVTIADFVADLRAPTPTAAAELLVRRRLEQETHFDNLLLRLASVMRGRLLLLEQQIVGLTRRLRSPQEELAWRRQRLGDLDTRLQQGMWRRLERARATLDGYGGRLDALSPLRTLSRGYAVVFAEPSHKVVPEAAGLAAGDRIRIRFQDGSVQALVASGRE
ncbi:MAG: exodeoxyribonuclease VII large subunit [Desulfuromonadales bacterium GWD2_61_12]|nr:MAG: exodeoxyribonuclease VII large subunit [Desulfuromonadales bacterium GWC2_61_20]OGR34934.1 MAG: exodeoxyribonuclease VII large subunit [Desulfuromonadales bacterium GWD2_61_12]HAD04424.1 exodeoxyribonuclease VII large subunit [Desulfuromonas sp.]